MSCARTNHTGRLPTVSTGAPPAEAGADRHAAARAAFADPAPPRPPSHPDTGVVGGATRPPPPIAMADRVRACACCRCRPYPSLPARYSRRPPASRLVIRRQDALPASSSLGDCDRAWRRASSHLLLQRPTGRHTHLYLYTPPTDGRKPGDAHTALTSGGIWRACSGTSHHRPTSSTTSLADDASASRLGSPTVRPPMPNRPRRKAAADARSPHLPQTPRRRIAHHLCPRRPPHRARRCRRLSSSRSLARRAHRRGPSRSLPPPRTWLRSSLPPARPPCQTGGKACNLRHDPQRPPETPTR